MRSRRGKYSAVVVATLAALALALSVAGGPAAAQSEPPAATEPVGAVLSPVGDEVSLCGNVSLALSAADLVLRSVTDAFVGAPTPGGELVVATYARALLLASQVDVAPCMFIPPSQVETRCGADDQVGSAIAQVPVPSGLPLPLDPVGLLPVSTDPAFAGALVDVLAALGPAGAISEPLGDRLDCETVKRTAADVPSFGSTGGGGVDLSPLSPSTREAADAKPAGRTGSARSTRVLGERIDAAPTTGARPSAAGDTAAGAVKSPQVATVAAQADTTTRRNIYGALAFLLAAAAAWGFVSPLVRSRHAP